MPGTGQFQQLGDGVRGGEEQGERYAGDDRGALLHRAQQGQGLAHVPQHRGGVGLAFHVGEGGQQVAAPRAVGRELAQGAAQPPGGERVVAEPPQLAGAVPQQSRGTGPGAGADLHDMADHALGRFPRDVQQLGRPAVQSAPVGERDALLRGLPDAVPQDGRGPAVGRPAEGGQGTGRPVRLARVQLREAGENGRRGPAAEERGAGGEAADGVRVSGQGRGHARPQAPGRRPGAGEVEQACAGRAFSTVQTLQQRGDEGRIASRGAVPGADLAVREHMTVLAEQRAHALRPERSRADHVVGPEQDVLHPGRFGGELALAHGDHQEQPARPRVGEQHGQPGQGGLPRPLQVVDEQHERTGGGIGKGCGRVTEEQSARQPAAPGPAYDAAGLFGVGGDRVEEGRPSRARSPGDRREHRPVRPQAVQRTPDRVEALFPLQEPHGASVHRPSRSVVGCPDPAGPGEPPGRVGTGAPTTTHTAVIS